MSDVNDIVVPKVLPFVDHANKLVGVDRLLQLVSTLDDAEADRLYEIISPSTKSDLVEGEILHDSSNSINPINRVTAKSEISSDNEFFCRRRNESPTSSSFPGPDYWQTLPNGDKVCSYCGSLSFEDMTRLIHASASSAEEADYRTNVEIEPSDKPYKVYVDQPGISNATQGGIKFYMMHCPRDADDKLAVTDEQNAEFALAVKRSRARFNKTISIK